MRHFADRIFARPRRSFRLVATVVATLATAVIYAYAAGEDPAVTMLFGHAGAPSSDHFSVCRDADAMERLQWLNEDLALAHVALDTLMAQYRRDTEYVSAKETGAEMDRVQARIRLDVGEIDDLRNLPPCEPEPGTPPPPPPPPPFPEGPGEPSSRTPTHRQTNCQACKGVADHLNMLIDELSALQSTHGSKGDVSILQSDITTYSLALDGCERICRVPQPQNQQVSPPQNPSHPKDDRSKDSSGGFMDDVLGHVSIGVGVGGGGGRHDDHGDHGDHGDSGHSDKPPPTDTPSSPQD